MTVTDTLQPDDYSGGRIERVDLDTGEVTVLYTECDGNPLMGPNDLVFDAEGGMWFTDHGKIRARERDHGGVYYAAPDGSSIREVIYPIESPNGIGLSPEGDRVYVAETHTGRVYWWPVDGPGVVGRARSGRPRREPARGSARAAAARLARASTRPGTWSSARSSTAGSR